MDSLPKPYPHPNHPKFKDLTSQTFDRLTVIHLCGRTKRGTLKWLCICTCGNHHIVIGGSLTAGRTKSCGCLIQETRRMKGRSTTHGLIHTPEYRSWYHMKTRCYNDNSKSYKNYGGRGITVCERWLSSFENFFTDMGQRPSSIHSIERIDNDGNYSPQNCRWATPTEQARNCRNNRFITYKGKTKCLAEWAKYMGMSVSVLRQRLLKLGWTIERALETPVRPLQRKRTD